MRIMHNRREGVGRAMARSDIATITSLDICGQTDFAGGRYIYRFACHRFAGSQTRRSSEERMGGCVCI